MDIEKAFCVELNRSINITEARNEFFAQEKPRKRFIFYCSSPECREKVDNPVLIKAINYDKVAEDKPSYQTAHFRSQEINAHSEDCKWVIEEEAKANIEQGNRKQSSKRKSTVVGDGYIEQSTFLVVEKRKNKNTDKITYDEDEIVSKKPRSQARSVRLKRAREEIERGLRSSSFSQLVHHYLKVYQNKQWNTPLQVKGLPIETYGQFFKKIEWYKPSVQENHAYFGSVQVAKVYPDGFDFTFGLPSGVNLKFDQEVTVDNITAKPTLYLTKDDFGGASSAHVLAETIQKVVEDANYDKHIWCHFYGEVRKKDVTFIDKSSKENKNFSTLEIVPLSMGTVELIFRAKRN